MNSFLSGLPIPVITVLVGFLSGSILYSKHLPRLLCGKDICAAAKDKNPGASNVFASCGVGLGLVCLACDMLKAYLPVKAALTIIGSDSLWFSAAMTAPVLGHAVGIFDGFHGGKCIAASFGVVLALFPQTAVGLLLAALYILFSTVLKIRPHRRRSILTFSLFGISALAILLYQHQNAIAYGTFGLSAIAVFRHLVVPDVAVDATSSTVSEE